MQHNLRDAVDVTGKERIVVGTQVLGHDTKADAPNPSDTNPYHFDAVDITTKANLRRIRSLTALTRKQGIEAGQVVTIQRATAFTRRQTGRHNGR